MADAVATFPTNRFAVQDRQTFERWLDARIRPNLNDDLTVHWSDGMVLLGAYDSPPNHDCDTDEDLDFMAELATHLAPGSVALLPVAGHEKLRSVFDTAEAVDAKGRRTSLDLHDIIARRRRPRMDNHRAPRRVNDTRTGQENTMPRTLTLAGNTERPPATHSSAEAEPAASLVGHRYASGPADTPFHPDDPRWS